MGITTVKDRSDLSYSTIFWVVLCSHVINSSQARDMTDSTHNEVYTLYTFGKRNNIKVEEIP